MTRDLSLDNPAERREEDEFNRWPFSKRLADTIAGFDSLSGAPVIGVFGRWGYGKSTVLNFVKEELRQNGRVEIFEFNPWMFKDQDALMASFFHGLAKAMDKSLEGTGKKVGEFLQDYSGLLHLIPVAGAGMGKIADRMAGKLTHTSLDEQRGQVIEMMKSARRNVVVLIDDLDRLDRDEILTMLKLVRLSANFPRVIYLLAFDDEMVARAAGDKYGGGAAAGRQFLEKIVQYPFYLPAVGFDRLVSFVAKRAREACDYAGVALKNEEWETFRRMNEECFAVRLTTPRQAIRYGNALRFAMPMLKHEVDPLQQMLVEGLRILFPEFYAVARDNSRYFTNIDNEKLEQKALEFLGDNKLPHVEIGAGVRLLEELFVSGGKARRAVASPAYFDRYFSYAVAREDIADAEIREVVRVAGAGAAGELGRLLKALFARNANTVVVRLREAGPEMDTVVAESLAFELATNRATAPTSDGLALLIAELTARDAFSFLRVTGAAVPLPFALNISREVQRVLRANPRQDQLMELRGVVHRRIVEGANTTPPYVEYGPDEAFHLMADWQSMNPMGVLQYTRRRLENHPREALAVLRMFQDATVNFVFITELVEAGVLAAALSTTAVEDMTQDERDKAREFLEAYERRVAHDPPVS